MSKRNADIIGTRSLMLPMYPSATRASSVYQYSSGYSWKLGVSLLAGAVTQLRSPGVETVEPEMHYDCIVRCCTKPLGDLGVNLASGSDHDPKVEKD